ncbi:unnamed protein product [marine sediment metagenome]|uniref:Uncharacterized protein n=1 Tax=marine sediment metagenome TaxID=412755 RepID=X1V392_9ZZZZ
MLTQWYSVNAMSKGRNTTVIGVRVPDSVNARIQALAAKQGLTVSEWCKVNLYRAASVLQDGAIRSHEKKGKGQGKPGS